jgi:riboflavin synthase
MSLTAVDRLADGFTVSFIPHTLAHTVAGSYQVGTQVNLEVDILGKYVERFLLARETAEKTEPPLSREFLARHGFQ